MPKVCPQVPLADLCEILGICAQGLATAGGLKPKPGQSDTISQVIDAFFNADLSVQDLMRLILKAAEMPLWRVHVGYRDEHGAAHSIETDCIVRAPDADRAGQWMIDRHYDGRLDAASCSPYTEAGLLEDPTEQVCAHLTAQSVGQDQCQHQAHEDCMHCARCGRCREDLDGDDLCSDCGGKDENAGSQPPGTPTDPPHPPIGSITDHLRACFEAEIANQTGVQPPTLGSVKASMQEGMIESLALGGAEAILSELDGLIGRYGEDCTVRQVLDWIGQASAVRVEDKAVRTGVHQVVCISAPHWYARDDFVAWLNSAQPARADGTVIATWHHPGHPPTDCSDLFTLYDHGEGSDAPDGAGGGMPQPIWDEIRRICQAKGIGAAIVWIQNC